MVNDARTRELVGLGIKYFDGKTEDISGINAYLNLLWNSQDPNHKFNSLSDDSNAANLIRTHTKVPLPYNLQGWHFYTPTNKPWAILYDDVNKKVYRVWAGFFKNSGTY